MDAAQSLSPQSHNLFHMLNELRDELDAITLENYSRVNPLGENLTDWRHKGAKHLSEGTVCFDSATLIGEINMGENCWIGLNCIIDGSGGLKIGHHCVFSSGTHIYTHDTAKWALSGGKESYHHAPVEIGDCVFIGAQSVVVAGVRIGSHSLICANATVLHDVPAYSIVAGTPATVIGKVIMESGKVEFSYFKRS